MTLFDKIAFVVAGLILVFLFLVLFDQCGTALNNTMKRTRLVRRTALKRSRFKVGKSRGLQRTRGLRKTPLRRVSMKRAAELKEYSTLRDDFLKRNPYCEVIIEGCVIRANEIHHMKGRWKLLNDTQYFMPICSSCHRYVEENKRWARRQGYILYK